MKEQPCLWCSGRGRLADHPCPRCSGTGQEPAPAEVQAAFADDPVLRSIEIVCGGHSEPEILPFEGDAYRYKIRLQFHIRKKRKD